MDNKRYSAFMHFDPIYGGTTTAILNYDDLIKSKLTIRMTNE